MTSIRKAIKKGKRKNGLKKFSIILRDKDGKKVNLPASIKKNWRCAVARLLNKK